MKTNDVKPAKPVKNGRKAVAKETAECAAPPAPAPVRKRDIYRLAAPKGTFVYNPDMETVLRLITNL